MARILVTDDSGIATWTERVTPTDFTSTHFQRCFCERLQWAVGDAEHHQPPVTTAPISRADRRREQPSVPSVAT